MNDVHIFFIYADNCEHCQAALTNIESAILKCEDTSCILHKFMYDSKEAITLAINRGIDDLPGVVIGKKVFVKECSEQKIIHAIKKVKSELDVIDIVRKSDNET